MRRVRRTSGYIVNGRKHCSLCMILGLRLAMAYGTWWEGQHCRFQGKALEERFVEFENVG